MLRVLGIESSCDETGASVIEVESAAAGGAQVSSAARGLPVARVLSDVVQSQVELHATYGGVVPELASRDHARNVGHVVRDALARAGVTLAQIDGIAVTHRPGLVGALLVGVQVAKGLAWGAEKPLVGVDHLLGHVLAVFLERPGEPARDVPSFPFCALLVSGGHTAIYRVDGPSAAQCTELGATRDDAAGEAFDKVGKLLGLGYPGGPRIDRLAAQGDRTKLPLRAPMATTPTFELSFSGLKTKLAQHVAAHGVPSGAELADVCASFQGAVTDVLADKLIRAAAREGIDDVVIGGGVAANRELRAKVSAAASQRGMRAFLPSLASCTDNAAMIALAGAVRLGAGERDGWDLVVTSQTSLARRTRKGGGPREKAR